MTEATVGIDIGTTSVKAIAADGDGNVLASARVPHPLNIPAPEEFEHDIDAAWRNGVRDAYAQVSRDLDIAAVEVAAMVPSLGAQRTDGSAAGPGLLYGDRRGRREGDVEGATPVERGELLGFLAWLRANCPDAEHFWPAQATANHTLSGTAALDTSTAFTAYPLFDGSKWDDALIGEVGVTADQLPELVAGFDPAGRVGGSDGPLLGGGTIDAMGEQVVAGADNDGDVLVICGTTLITWAVMKGEEWIEQPGLWTIPHTAPGKLVIGGPSNAGGLFLNWARQLTGGGDAPTLDDLTNIPVWLPYVRGERTPLHRNDLRASLHGVDLTHTPAHVVRAAFEAAGFVVRHHLDLSGDLIAPQRIVATGGGARVDEWVQALADCTGLPVDIVAVPEGGALGSAFIARCVAGLDAQMSDGARWAKIGRRIEPNERFRDAIDARYEQFRTLTDKAVASG